MRLVDWLFVTAAVSRVSLVWGVLLIAAGLTALAVLGRDQLARLARPILARLGLPAPRGQDPVDLEPSGEIPPFVREAMRGYRGEHRRQRRGLRSRSAMCRSCPSCPASDTDAPTVVMPAVRDGNKDGGNLP